MAKGIPDGDPIETWIEVSITQKSEWWSLQIVEQPTGYLVWDFNGTLGACLNWVRQVLKGRGEGWGEVKEMGKEVS